MVRPVKNKYRGRDLGSVVRVAVLAGLKRLLLVALPYVLCLTLVGVLGGSVAVYAVNSPTFQLEEVRILNTGTLKPEQAFAFCDLRKGENLITLDLVGVQQVIKKKYPEFKEVLVRRVLPNRVEVLLKRRTPAAQIAFSPSRYVQVDKDLVVLPGSGTAPFKNLVILQGVSAPAKVVPGTKIQNLAARKALKLAWVVKDSKILRDHALTKVDITDPKSFTLVVDSGIEIYMGASHFMERLKLLAQTLKAIELDRSKIQYIDLRFDDVAIGTR